MWVTWASFAHMSVVTNVTVCTPPVCTPLIDAAPLRDSGLQPLPSPLHNAA